ncbi:AAA family ATPase [Mailhella sp.]|uniref:AAA family ATPase n=1 Tax=Mailhella sp. TaxID=1981029 RepID=UPI004062C7CC
MSTDFGLVEKARGILSAHGLVVNAVDCSGELVYCGTSQKPNGTDGRYKVHTDFPPSLWVCNYHEGGEGQTFPLYESGTLNAMTEAEKEELRARIQREQEEARRKREERQQEAAREAKEIFSSLRLAGEENAYLRRKGVLPLGNMKQDDAGRLVLPVQNSAGAIVSLQRIFGDDEKRYLSGGEKKGCYFPIPAKDGDKDGTLLIGEGVATVLSCCMATGYAGLVAFDAGNLLPVAQMARAKYADRVIVLCADNDIHADGKPNVGVLKATAAAKAIGAKLAICPAIRGQKADFNDLFTDTEDGPERVRVVIEKAVRGETEKKKSAYRCVNIAELVGMDFPPRRPLLSPVFAVQSLSMVYAMRGVGKTHFALSCAYAVASGGGVFGCWFAPTPARVLYIDGEMPALTLQERLQAIANGADADITDPDLFKILTPDMQETGMPNLATKEGQAFVEPFLDGVSLVVVDNVSTLARTGKANDEDSWLPVQEWLLELRRRGISVLLVHHANKNGTQRGTGAKEDILDNVIELKRPGDYQAEEGARFEVHFSKARGLYGEDVEPFEASLSIDEQGQCIWTTRRVEDVLDSKIAELLREGFSEREIVDELKAEHVGRTRVRRVKKELEAKGVVFAKSKGGAGTHRAR